MHGAEGMLKPAMLRRGKNPTGALKLIDVAQALHPWRVDERFFSNLAFFLRNGELNIAVDGIGNQRRAAVVTIDGLRHGFSLVKI
jgi:hypothetical protein